MVGSGATRTDVLGSTRLLAAVIIPFLVIATAILYGVPGETRRLFAWEIRPPMTAMMLGSAYAGGVWFFVRVIVAGSWREVKAGFLAVGTFATVLGVTTVLHWDRFNQDSVSFFVWGVLYFTTPFLVLGAWIRQEASDADSRGAEPVLPRPARALLWVTAASTLAIAVSCFVAPDRLSGVWPWALTPLTARVMSAMFALPGLVAVGIALDPRWSVARYLIEAQVASIVLILVGSWRDRQDIDTGSPAGLGFVVGLGGLGIAYIALYWLGRRTDRSMRRAGLEDRPDPE